MNLREAKGDWALVTGASAGIGREFAVQLAEAGMNVILAARRDSLIIELGKEIISRYSVKTLSLQTDVTSEQDIHNLKQTLASKGIKVRLLVNNAGCASCGCFEKIPLADYIQIVHLNALAPVYLTYSFFDDLASFPSSAVINVASSAAFNPVPYMAVYAASKAFVSNFGQALYGELGPRGIMVQTLLPGPTITDLGNRAVEFAPVLKKISQHPRDVVAKSLTELARGTPLVITGKGTLKQRVFSAIFPRKIVLRMVARMFKPKE